MKILLFCCCCFIVLVQYRSYKLSYLKSGTYVTVFKSIVKAFLQISFSSVRKQLKFIKLWSFIVFIRFIYPGIFCTF